MPTNSIMIGELSITHKLDGTNYEMWHCKIMYLLNDGYLFEHLMVPRATPSDKDRDGKPIDTTSMQYQEMAKAYQDRFNKDRKACFTTVYCMQHDLIGEFEAYPTAEDTWDKPRIKFSQTSATRLCTFHLK